MRKRLWAATLSIVLMAGGPMIFAKSGDIPKMTKDELRGMLGNPDLVIIDVRYSKDWTESDLKIQGAIREDPKIFDSWANKYPKDKILILYCA